MTDDLVKRLHKWVDDLEHDRDYDLEFELSGEEAGNFANDICGMLTRVEKLQEQAHYATGVADLAMKHRDYAEQRVEKLEAALRFIAGPSTVEFVDGTYEISETKMLSTYRRRAKRALEGNYDD